MSRQKYAEEFGREAVRLTYQPGRSLGIIAEELAASLDHWRKIHQAGARRSAHVRNSGGDAGCGCGDSQIVVDAEEYRQLKLESVRQDRDI